MKKFSVTTILISVLLTVHSVTSQISEKSLVKTFRDFEQNIRTHKEDTTLALQYAKDWLNLAKKQKDFGQQLKAYQHTMHLVEKKYRMIYADSLLDTALMTKDNAFIGGAYLTIGAAHYNNRALDKALDLYLMANSYISKTKDLYLIHKVKYTIAQTKYHLGFYDEAITLFTECIAFFKEHNSTAYIKSLHSIGLCYNRIERHDLCSFNNQLGIKQSNQLEIKDMIPYFKNSEGINQYKLKNYKEAIHLLNESLSGIEKNNDVANETVTWFYLGKSYWAKNKKEHAIEYFNKVIETIEIKKLIRPDIR